MRGAVPCLSTDLTIHAVPHFIQALKMGRRAAPKALNDSVRQGPQPATCEVFFGARRRGRRRWGARSAVRRRGDVFLGACRRRRRRGGLKLYQLRAAWGATGQLSDIWLGLWVSASGGAAQSASIYLHILQRRPSSNLNAPGSGPNHPYGLLGVRYSAYSLKG